MQGHNADGPRRALAVAAVAALVALSTFALACNILGPQRTNTTSGGNSNNSSTDASPAQSGVNLTDANLTHELAVASVSFDPKPEKEDKVNGVTDLIFGGMDKLKVTAQVKNSGTAEETNIPVVARLYATRSGNLPKETADQLEIEKTSRIGSLKPGQSTPVEFTFTGMGKYAQSTHMLMRVEVQPAQGEDNAADNVSRTYFWSLLGE